MTKKEQINMISIALALEVKHLESFITDKAELEENETSSALDAFNYGQLQFARDVKQRLEEILNCIYKQSR